MSTLKVNTIQRTASGWLDYKSDNHSIKDYDAGDAFIVCNHDAAVDLFYDGAKKLETTSTGINITGGIRLGGNNAVNELDDYEEGSFTPVLSRASSNHSGTVNSAAGRYTKIGRVVDLWFAINVSGMTSPNQGSGYWNLSLPFTTASDVQGWSIVGSNQRFHFNGSERAGGDGMLIWTSTGNISYAQMLDCDDDTWTTGDAGHIIVTGHISFYT
tara:strand:+ start:54 stop:695 length:642 start_codon:yes stop_codon:yes gene_type:complete